MLLQLDRIVEHCEQASQRQVPAHRVQILKVNLRRQIGQNLLRDERSSTCRTNDNNIHVQEFQLAVCHSSQ